MIRPGTVAVLALCMLVAGGFQRAEAAEGAGNFLIAQKPAQRGVVGMRLDRAGSGEFVVGLVVQGGPAQGAGVSAGDRLLSVDGRSVKGLSLPSVVQMITGAPGTTVSVSLRSRQNGDYTRRIKRSAPPSGYGIANSGSSSSSSTGSSKRLAAHSSRKIQWLSYTSPDGSFSMQVPDGWEVKTGKNGTIEVYSYADESISIWPFFLPKTRVSMTQAAGLFNALIKTRAAGQKWSAPEQVGNGLRATCKEAGHRQVVSLVVRPMKFGTMGRLFLAKAPDGYTQHYSSIFSKILSSLRFNKDARPGASPDAVPGDTNRIASRRLPPPLSWTTFTDPKQGAFTLEVPQGWNVQGGMEQPGSLDYRGWVRAISPGEDVVVFLGDASIPVFTIPTMQLASYGFVPGSRYNPGGYSSIIAAYVPSKKFVVDYGKKSLKKIKMSNIQLVETHDHPQLARQLNSSYQNLADFGASSCKFTALNKDGVPVVGHFLGSTRKARGLWWMTLIAGVVCGAQEEGQGLQAFGHMFETFKVKGSWQSGQTRSIVQAYRGITQYYARYNEVIRQSFAASDAWRRSFSRQASASLRDTSRSANRFTDRDEWMRQATNNIRDTQDVVDPNTGEVYNIWSGGEHHYLSNDGFTVMSTNQPIYPSANWTELSTLP